MPKLCLALLLFLLPTAPDEPHKLFFPFSYAPAPVQTEHRLLFPLWFEPPPVRKDGVGWTYASCADVARLGALWYQDWSPTPSYCGEDYRALAMIWNWQPGQPLPDVPWYAWGVQLTNEANLSQQGNMPPAWVAELTYLADQTYPALPLLGPATFNDVAYVEAVYAYYLAKFGVPPPWDVLTAHCYYPTAAECLAHIEDLLEIARRYNPPLKIGVSEWGILPCPRTTLGVLGQPDLARAQAEATQLRAALEAHPEVLFHLWFATEIKQHEWWAFQPAACNTGLFSAGALTPWGHWYVEHTQTYGSR